MTMPRFARSASIIAQQIRKITPKGKDSARVAFIPDLCSVSALASLVLIGELLALILTLATDGLRPFNWQRLGLVSFTVQWVTLLAAAALCRLRPQLAAMPHKLAGACSFLCVLCLLLLVLTAQQGWMANLEQRQFDYWMLLSHALIGAICAGVMLRYAYVQQQLVNQQQAELGARIEALQSRIRPHFLFNSLNSLVSLIATDPERAERLVEDLSVLFRASLADLKIVPLEQELTLARRYLAIEALRLGERLQQRWQVESCPPQAELPSMLLQPLLENAVLHGIARRREGGEIVIDVRAHRDQLWVTIENSLGEDGSSCQLGNGMAINNIRQRLAALYDGAFKFTAAAEEGIYRVALQLPLSATGGKPSQATTSIPLSTTVPSIMELT